jgi:hypothetical protein
MQDPLTELMDRQAIADLMYRYAEGIDRRDPVMLASVFTDDAVLHYGVGLFEGPARNLVANWRSDRPSPFLATHHHVGNIRIHFRGANRARSITYLSAVHRARRDGKVVDEIVRARYFDKLVKQDGKWLIAERSLVYDWSRVAPAGEREWWEQPGAVGIVSAHGSGDPSVAFLGESD